MAKTTEQNGVDAALGELDKVIIRDFHHLVFRVFVDSFFKKKVTKELNLRPAAAGC